MMMSPTVVICFLFSIFDVLETTLRALNMNKELVVICFLFSIFDVLETTASQKQQLSVWL